MNLKHIERKSDEPLWERNDNGAYIFNARISETDLENFPNVPHFPKINDEYPNVLTYMISLGRFWSIETNGWASNSQMRRWIEQGAVWINWQRVSPKDILNYPLFSVILFPKSDKRRTTLY